MGWLRDRLSRFKADEDGAGAVVMAVTLPAMVGILFMGVEAGHFRQNNARYQAAVDEAAMAAAIEYGETGDVARATLIARATARLNGFDPAEGTLTVTPSITGGTYDGEEGLTLAMTQAQPRYFSKIFPVETEVVHSVDAVALIGGEGRLFCVLALNTTAKSALTVSGTSDLDLPNCGLHSNSSATPSFDNQGSGWVRADCVSAVGTVRDSGGILLDVCEAPESQVRPVRDPYADITMPANWQSLPCSTPLKGGKVTTFEAGKRYCDSMAIKDTVNFVGKGHYIFDGALLSVKSDAVITGDPGGVALLFANNAQITSQNGGTYNLTAMPDGPYAGILMYGDRDTQSGIKQIINGNQDATLNGVLYFPNDTLHFNGGADLMSDCTQIVADTIEFTGTSAMTNTNCEARGARPISGLATGKAALVR